VDDPAAFYARRLPRPGSSGYWPAQACSKAITSLAFVCMSVTTS
jgi:hypothetical protein